MFKYEVTSEYERFELLGHAWDVNKAKEVLNRRDEIELHDIPVKEWSQVLEWIPVDKDAEGVDLDVPIIIGTTLGGNHFVIDGHHRLDRAKRQGVKQIKAALMTADETAECET